MDFDIFTIIMYIRFSNLELLDSICKHVLCIVHLSQRIIKSKRGRAADTIWICGCIDNKYIRHICIIDRLKKGSKKNRNRDIEGDGNRDGVESVIKLKPFKNQC